MNRAGLPHRKPWNLSLRPLHQAAGADLSIAQLADRIGVSARAVTRWATEGIPAPSADRAAISLGRHPNEIWGAFAYELAEQCNLAAQRAGRIRSANHTYAHRPRNDHVTFEPNDRFCGRDPNARAGKPHRCATDGCRCPTATEAR